MLDENTTPHQLASLLGTSYSKLCYVVYKQGVDNLYEDFKVKKAAGGERTISSPKFILKNIQRKLKELLESLYKPHPSATAFIKGRGIVYNAKKHKKKALVFNVDMSDFYGSIHFGRVRGLLESKPYCLQRGTAQMIAHISCYKGVIPQGAPTSPVISNMICRRLDRQLSLLAKQNEAYYTRYADDVTFSFSSSDNNGVCEISHGAWMPTKKFLELIEDNGFYLNKDKTRGQDYKTRQVVTGLKVNNKVNVDRRYIRTTRAMLHSLCLDIDLANQLYSEKFPDRGDVRLEKVVAGRVNFIGMVKGLDSSVYQTLALKFNTLPIELSLPLRKSVEKNSNIQQMKAKHKSYQEFLEKRVWVLEFDGVSECDQDEQLIQGTAFMVKGNNLITAAHSFDKAGNPSYCYVKRISSVGKKYRAEVIGHCNVTDVAKLEIIDPDGNDFENLNVYHKEEIHVGYQVSLVGFPQHRAGHKTISINPCKVTGQFVKSMINHFEVNTEIAGGLSGGPVLNDYYQVIGMVVTGRTGSSDDKGSIVIEGHNSFVSSEHFF